MERTNQTIADIVEYKFDPETINAIVKFYLWLVELKKITSAQKCVDYIITFTMRLKKKKL
jgi:hypothetical protein